jgi:hypothetical protein
MWYTYTILYWTLILHKATATDIQKFNTKKKKTDIQNANFVGRKLNYWSMDKYRDKNP